MEALRALVVPEDWHLVADAIERAAVTGDFVDVEYRFHYGDERRPRWITARGQPIFHPDGAPDRLMGICFDITERRLAVDALHTSEARLAAGAQLAGLGFYEIDYAARSMYLDSRTKRASSACPTAWRTASRAVEFWDSTHVHPEDRARVAGHASAAACGAHRTAVDRVPVRSPGARRGRGCSTARRSPPVTRRAP